MSKFVVTYTIIRVTESTMVVEADADFRADIAARNLIEAQLKPGETYEIENVEEIDE